MVFFEAQRGFPEPEELILDPQRYRPLFDGKPYRPPGKSKKAGAEHLRELAEEMVGEDVDGKIPAAYTYLGQFIDHDVTFDSASSPTESREEDGRRNLRSPSLDLDSLYGSSPAGRPALYGPRGASASRYFLRVGRSSFNEQLRNYEELDVPRLAQRYARLGMNARRKPFASVVSPRGEVRRVAVRREDVVQMRGTRFISVRGFNSVRTVEGWLRAAPSTLFDIGGHAVLGDPRNDENVIVSQLHLAFQRFHNAAMELALEDTKSPQEAFRRARQEVRWHYQWLVVHDYLRRIVGDEAWETLLHELLPADRDQDPEGALYDWKEGAFIPTEFSMAAFRFGHAMVRSTYRLNELPDSQGMPTREIPLFVQARNPLPKADLRGGRQLPDRWSVQWNLFLDVDGSTSQKSRPIGETLAAPMVHLRIPFQGRRETLPFVTLFRGWQAGLPSGQTLAKQLDIPPLRGNDPLWYYVLREARDQGDGGAHLGPLGARLVSETLLGIVREHRGSFYKSAPSSWRPTWGRRRGEFDLEDLLRMAGAPITLDDVGQSVFGRSPSP